MVTTGQVLSELAGKTRKAASRLAGDKGIIAALKADHQRILSLLGQIPKQAREPADVDTARELFATLYVELFSHGEAEAKSIYAKFAGRHEAEELTAKALGEHKALSVRMKSLLDAEPGTPRWAQTLNDVEREFRQHVEEEETHLLALAGVTFSKEELVRLERRFEKEKRATRDALIA